MLKFFFLLFLSVFYCICPKLLQGEFLHANETSFPTWQRFTHAINFSCVLWLILRLPMEVSWQIRWEASSRLLFSNSRSTWHPKLECQSLSNTSSLTLSNSHIAYLGDGGVRVSLCTTGLLTCVLVLLFGFINWSINLEPWQTFGQVKN